jgi:hypothetical protein
LDTTVVTTTVVGALAGVIAGLGGAAIAVRTQQAHEQHRRRERAAEVFGSMGPLLVELHPDRILFNLPVAQPGQPDPMNETLRLLGERTRAVREQLSALAVWWPTAHGSALAQRLQVALLNTWIADGWLVSDHRRSRDTKDALKKAQKDWNEAQSIADELRAEIRGQATPTRPSPRVGLGAPGPSRPLGWRARRTLR